jgi:hypothetical protein
MDSEEDYDYYDMVNKLIAPARVKETFFISY